MRPSTPGLKSVASVTAVALLLSNYIGAVGLAYALPGAFNVPVMVAAHVALGAALILEVSMCAVNMVLQCYGVVLEVWRTNKITNRNDCAPGLMG
jgi:hypothetical protein